MKGFSATALTRNNVYNIVYVIVLFILLQYVIPTIVLVCLNARVIVALRRSDIHRSSIVATSSGRRSMTSLNPPDSAVVLTQSQLTPPLAPPINAIIQSTRSITVVVTAIVSLCIVVHVVALAAHIAWAVSKVRLFR
jgi:hypothetical protein